MTARVHMFYPEANYDNEGITVSHSPIWSCLFSFLEWSYGRMMPWRTLWQRSRNTKGCEEPGTSKVDSM